VGGALARDSGVTLTKKRWRTEQRRYHEILREIRSHLSRDGMCGVVRLLRRTAPDYLTKDSVRKTRDDARTMTQAVERLGELLHQETLSPELRLRLEPERERLLNSLDEVKRICVQAEVNQPGNDPVRIWCARIAFTLLNSFSNETPSSGSADSRYRVITSLLYEILTGEQGRDLKRACDEHLKAMRPLLHPGSSA
jgi:hypothetical protein